MPEPSGRLTWRLAGLSLAVSLLLAALVVVLALRLLDSAPDAPSAPAAGAVEVTLQLVPVDGRGRALPARRAAGVQVGIARLRSGGRAGARVALGEADRRGRVRLADFAPGPYLAIAPRGEVARFAVRDAPVRVRLVVCVHACPAGRKPAAAGVTPAG